MVRLSIRLEDQVTLEHPFSGALISVKSIGINETDSKIDANKKRLTPEGSSTANKPWPSAKPPQTIIM